MSNDVSGNFPTRTYRNLSMSTTGVLIKTGPSQIFAVIVYNNATAARYLKFYDKATAGTASDTPVLTVGLTASALNTFTVGQGSQFLLGLSVRATNLVADNDATAPTANDVVLNVEYL